MPYFHESICFSPQHSFPEMDLSQIRESDNNLLNVVEPEYPGIPAGAKRRMGKSVRMAVGAALPLLEKYPVPSGIIIATANGGMEDCIKFLNQILEYKEGLLTPASFVQSTSNAAAAQIALVTKNHQYNTTHVHRGGAFENALLDVIMLLKENPEGGYLLGSTDEISPYNYNIDRLAGWYANEYIPNRNLYESKAKGTIAGEGAFMVYVNNDSLGASARLDAVKTLHTEDPAIVLKTLQHFISASGGEAPDFLLTGENGDERQRPYFDIVESFFDSGVTVARFKHLSGEYCTATSFAVWLSIQMIQSGKIPSTLIKKKGNSESPKKILIYNNYRGLQHSFILISALSVKH
jgi:hypothetical protein